MHNIVKTNEVHERDKQIATIQENRFAAKQALIQGFNHPSIQQKMWR